MNTMSKCPSMIFQNLGAPIPVCGWTSVIHTSKCTRFLYQWVCTAVLYLEGHAALWWHAFKRGCATVDWGAFASAVTIEFSTEEFDTQMAKLLQMRQIGTVMEYRMTFEACMYHLLSLDETLNNKFFVAQFVLGLKDELRTAVRLHAPSSVTRAMALARIQEEELENHRPRGRPMAGHKLPPPALVVPAIQQGPQRQDWPKRAGNDNYNRERQLRDFRRANNLCFRCGEKFGRDHQCKKPLQLLTIHVGEHGEIFTEDTVQALELLEEPAAPQRECHLMFSQHAEAGSEGSGTMKFRTLVGNQVCPILVDFGSSTSFVNANFVARAALPTVQVQPVSVKVANGELMQSNTQVSQLAWWMQGHTFYTDMRVLPLGAYDAVLGMDWLESHSPMTVDWILKFMEVPSQGKMVRLQGELPQQQRQLAMMTIDDVQKSFKGNDLWAIALVDFSADTTSSTSAPDTKSIPPDLKHLLDEFSDVFQDPKSLPPHRQYDHAIARN